MSIIKAVLIPADTSKDVTEVEYDTSDYKNLTKLIFDGRTDGTFDRMATMWEGKEITLWFDDEGMFRLENEKLEDIVNLRAMHLYAHCEGVGVGDFAAPLVGDYVVLGGADDEGDSLPVPDGVKDFQFAWHVLYSVKPRG